MKRSVNTLVCLKPVCMFLGDTAFRTCIATSTRDLRRAKKEAKTAMLGTTSPKGTSENDVEMIEGDGSSHSPAASPIDKTEERR